MIRTLTEAARRDWLRLARTENVGPVAFAQLITRYGEASLALAALPDLARRGGRISPLGAPSQEEIRREMQAGEALGARLLCAGEADYPAALAAADPPPPVIWARGDIALLNRPVVAVVGARVASAGGQRFARGLAADDVEVGALLSNVGTHAFALGTQGVDVFPESQQQAVEQAVTQTLQRGVEDAERLDQRLVMEIHHGLRHIATDHIALLGESELVLLLTSGGEERKKTVVGPALRFGQKIPNGLAAAEHLLDILGSGE